MGDLSLAKESLRALMGDEELGRELTKLDQLLSSPTLSTSLRTTPSVLSLLSEKRLREPLVFCSVVLVAQQLSGINAVFYFSSEIFHTMFGSIFIARIFSAVLGLVNVLAAIVAVAIIERVGKRTLLLVSQLGMAVCSISIIILMLVRMQILVVIAFAAFIVFYAIGLGPIPWVLLGEMFPSAWAGAASSFAVAISWLANYLVGVSFLPLVKEVGAFSFLPFVACLVFALRFTKDRLEVPAGRTVLQVGEVSVT
mmetsp:Transcript_3445/g.6468  ORF Transcript_3445/g.6468 Transcript_3445/m.6468 type:complete len:254 (-) Transcript_3445:1347-2108(-)